MKCLDTTFLIDFLRGEQRIATRSAQLHAQQFCTTAINLFEVCLGIHALQNEKERMRELQAAEALFHLLPILPLDQQAAAKAGEFAGMLIRKGLQTDEQDCLTAAIALRNGIPNIVTRNVSHFQRIPGLTVESH